MKFGSLAWYTSAWLSGLAVTATAGEATIEDRLDRMQKTIESQQREIDAQRAQIRALRELVNRRRKPLAVEAHGAPVAAPAVDARLAAQQMQIDTMMQKLAQIEVPPPASLPAAPERPTVAVDTGRLKIASPDGRFSLAVRALGQLDAAYYMQSRQARLLPIANGPDLSSGANFRRAQLGIQGKLFGDWTYLFNTEFGGSGGTESGGRVQALYAQYDGLAPFAFRIGAYPPAGGLEDNTGSADTLFLERASPSDIIRNAVGGDGRDAASVLYVTDTLYGSVSYTGGKVGDGAVFDEEESLLARAAASLYSDDHSRVVISVTGADMFRGPDAAPGVNSPRSLSLAVSPELTVDSTGTKLVSTGGIDTENARFWGMEAGATWNSLFAQAGYFGYEIDPRSVAAGPTLPHVNFDGWYAQASWVISGESRSYNKTTAVFSNPKPAVPFSLSNGTWGAWELAARYSDVDLNDRSGSLGLATPFGGVRGGEQKIWTAGLNWYPNTILRFSLDYQWIDIDRLGGSRSNVGQNLQAMSLRSQIAL